MGDEGVAAGEVDDAASAEAAAGAAGDLPGFVELFSREAVGLADDAGDAVKQGVSLEVWEIARAEAGAAGEAVGQAPSGATREQRVRVPSRTVPLSVM